MKRSLKATWLVPAAALAMMGCPDEELAPLEPCTVSGVSNEITQSGTDQLDLLFVIDNSGSMEQEQQKIAVQLPRLVKILASGDLDGDQVLDFSPVKSLHLGVVTTNMGTQGSFTAGSCVDRGDDGILLNKVGPAAEGDPACQGLDLDRYQSFTVPEEPAAVEGAAEAAANEFGCVAALGTTGCGLEQQLEAMLKAVTPDDSEEFTFAEGKGHGNKENDGFVRDDAVFAVIHVTDEEDCSVTRAGRSLFAAKAEDEYNGPVEEYAGAPVGINFQCANASDSPDDDPDLLQPTDRFIAGLKALKPSNPERIVFAAIAGIPLEAEGSDFVNGDVQDFDKILELGDMQVLPNREDYPDNDAETDPENRFVSLGELPRPACRTAADGSASPARRFVEVAKGFAANGIVRSICADSYESSLTVILEKISKQFQGACLPQPLNPDNQGVVACDVVEILPIGASQDDCILTQGRRFKENRVIAGPNGNETHVVCDVNQVAVKDGNLVAGPAPLEGVNPTVGWYYDDFSPTVEMTCPEGQRRRIATTEGAEPSAGATFRFECFNPVGGDLNKAGQAAVGAACREDDQCKSDDLYNLFCEPINNTCQIECEGDAACPDGWVCDTLGGEKSYCVNPKCPPANAG